MSLWAWVPILGEIYTFRITGVFDDDERDDADDGDDDDDNFYSSTAVVRSYTTPVKFINKWW